MYLKDLNLLLRGSATQNRLIFQLCFIMPKIKLYIWVVLSEYKKQVVYYHKKRVFYYKKQKNKKQPKILFFFVFLVFYIFFMYKAMFWVVFYILYGWLHENNS